MASSTCHVVGVAKRVRLERIVSPLLAETTPDSSSDPSVPSSVGGGPRTLQCLSSSSALAVRRPLLELEFDQPSSSPACAQLLIPFGLCPVVCENLDVLQLTHWHPLALSPKTFRELHIPPGL